MLKSQAESSGQKGKIMDTKEGKKLVGAIAIIVIVLVGALTLHDHWVAKQLSGQTFDIKSECPSGYEVVTSMYTVKSRDTYWSIAKEVKASNDAMASIDTRDIVNAIYYASAIPTYSLKDGDVLYIPQWKVSGARLAEDEFNGYVGHSR